VSIERFRRIVETLNRRQPDLTVLMENVHKAHNLSAISRTCDAVGIGVVHAVAADPDVHLSHKRASGTEKWIDMVSHDSTAEAYARLRRRGFRLLAADLGKHTSDYRTLDYTTPCAIVIGSELDGLTPAAANDADALLRIPLAGMVDCLNVSVAAALILFEAMRQRDAAGLYDQRRLDDDTFTRLRFEWMHPSVARYCRRKGIAYPRLDESGELLEPVGGHPRSSFAQTLPRR
jgi:tRNA (guanosine-2'-O-)-methyltransferase